MKMKMPLRLGFIVSLRRVFEKIANFSESILHIQKSFVYLHTKTNNKQNTTPYERTIHFPQNDV